MRKTAAGQWPGSTPPARIWRNSSPPRHRVDLSSELEQFIPAVMAALPLIRTGIGIYGRDKLVRLIARLLAQLIKSLTGMEATRH